MQIINNIGFSLLFMLLFVLPPLLLTSIISFHRRFTNPKLKREAIESFFKNINPNLAELLLSMYSKTNKLEDVDFEAARRNGCLSVFGIQYVITSLLIPVVIWTHVSLTTDVVLDKLICSSFLFLTFFGLWKAISFGKPLRAE